MSGLKEELAERQRRAALPLLSLPQAEAAVALALAAEEKARGRRVDQKNHVANLKTDLATALIENEAIREAMATAIAEDVPYDDEAPRDIIAREAVLAEAELIHTKMGDVFRVKSRARGDAQYQLHVAQVKACRCELERRGWTDFDKPRWSAKSFAPFTMTECFEMEQLLARIEMRVPSLAHFLGRIDASDWRPGDAVDRALDAARKGTGDAA